MGSSLYLVADFKFFSNVSLFLLFCGFGRGVRAKSLLQFKAIGKNLPSVEFSKNLVKRWCFLFVQCVEGIGSYHEQWSFVPIS